MAAFIQDDSAFEHASDSQACKDKRAAAWGMSPFRSPIIDYHSNTLQISTNVFPSSSLAPKRFSWHPSSKSFSVKRISWPLCRARRRRSILRLLRTLLRKLWGLRLIRSLLASGCMRSRESLRRRRVLNQWGLEACESVWDSEGDVSFVA